MQRKPTISSVMRSWRVFAARCSAGQSHEPTRSDEEKEKQMPRGQRAQAMEKRVASLAAVPGHVLSADDRRFALHWIRQGYKVRAYQSHNGHWHLDLAGCHIDLAQFDRDRDRCAAGVPSPTGWGV